MPWNDQDGVLCIYRKESNRIICARRNLRKPDWNSRGKIYFMDFFKGNRNSISFKHNK